MNTPGSRQDEHSESPQGNAAKQSLPTPPPLPKRMDGHPPRGWRAFWIWLLLPPCLVALSYLVLVAAGARDGGDGTWFFVVAFGLQLLCVLGSGFYCGREAGEMMAKGVQSERRFFIPIMILVFIAVSAVLSGSGCCAGAGFAGTVLNGGHRGY